MKDGEDRTAKEGLSSLLRMETKLDRDILCIYGVEGIYVEDRGYKIVWEMLVIFQARLESAGVGSDLPV